MLPKRVAWVKTVQRFMFVTCALTCLCKLLLTFRRLTLATVDVPHR